MKIASGKVRQALTNRSDSGLVLVAHACNAGYSGGRDQEDHGLKSAWQIVHEILYSTQNRAGGMTQGVESLPSKCEALCSNPSISKKKTQ
jgi:hypothetical protein